MLISKYNKDFYNKSNKPFDNRFNSLNNKIKIIFLK